MPAWLPLPLLIANTLLVEAAVAVAIYWLIVRRAENPARARFRFVAATLVIAGIQGLSAIEVWGTGGRHEHAIGRHARTPIVAAFSWRTSVVLRRGPEDATLIVYVAPGSNVSRQNALTGIAIPPALWAFHDAPDTRESVAAFCDALRRSPSLSLLPPEIAAVLSKE